MSKIFISYTRSDIEKARAIYDFLLNEGHEPWMDVLNLFPGQDWKLEIQKSIENSDFFIACLSNNSINKKGFVQKELKTAIEVLELMPEGEIYLIPIRLELCKIPHSLMSRQWLDWFSEDAHSQLQNAIKKPIKQEKKIIESETNLLLAIAHIKTCTKALYPELLRCTQEFINHTQPEIRNSTIKKIQSSLNILKNENIFDYSLTTNNLTFETVNRIYIFNIDILKLKQLIDKV